MQNLKEIQKSPGRLSGIAVASFALSLFLCTFLVSATIRSKINIEKLQMEQLILEKSLRITEMISKYLYKTQALSAIIIQGDGNLDDFDKIAPVIVDDPVIQNVFAAPGGIISKVYPLEGNEMVVGMNLFSQGAGNSEAAAARDLGRLVLGGPFSTVQGMQVLTGRLPVYIDTPSEKQRFWGLVSITLKFPQVIDEVLGNFKTQGFVYELWRISPETNEKQVISANNQGAPPNAHFIERPVPIVYAEWYLKVSATRTWTSYPENLALIVAGLFISFLVLFIMQNNSELRRMWSALEVVAKSDPLTGIFNRRFLEENLKRVIRSLSRSGGVLSVLMIDVDFFKKYNDTYGHHAGDNCLKIIAGILTKSLSRADDFVARYGGEEFVVVLPNTDENGACLVANNLLENMRKYNLPHETSSVAEYVTISIGLTTGKVEHTQSGDDYVERADKALYMSKQGGRDRYTFQNFDEAGV
ncbi:MAG: sensor domain-containing diguanylate cyclase [Treponema sp.]|nr:sensor domain-containing diguanylate cyclase [Treponema sp.]